MNGIKHINMDYEKAYKAALETATKWIKDGCIDKEKICLECVFPELRESEDERNERIRKAILGLSYLDGIEPILTKCSVTRSDIRSYLKKQKESLHIPETCKENADSFTDEDERIIEGFYTLIRGIRRDGGLTLNKVPLDKCEAWLEKQKEPKNVSATTMAPSCWEVEQKEQKPPIAGNDFGWIDELKHDLEHPEELDQKVDDVLKQRKGIRALEWSEEDEKMLLSIINAFRNGTVSTIGQEQWLKNLPKRFNLKPKEEWSENDEKILDELLNHCNTENATWYNWLKSLRPSWKPSEEQMRVLKQVEDRVAMKSGYWEQVLDSLYCDLQKL